MIGLILIAHGRLGQALLDSARMIVGPQERACAVTLDRERSPEEASAEVSAALADVGRDGDGVLIMTDMFGGTPSNVSSAFLDGGGVELLTGVNLPMVLKFFGSRQGAQLTELCLLLRGYGQQGILRALDLLQARNEADGEHS